MSCQMSCRNSNFNLCTYNAIERLGDCPSTSKLILDSIGYLAVGRSSRVVQPAGSIRLYQFQAAQQIGLELLESKSKTFVLK